MQSKIKHFIIMMVMCVTATLFASAAPAHAVSYHVTGTGGVGLRARTAPNTSSGVMRMLAEGAAIDISCQTQGENVRGSAIWDRLSDGTYISDFYTTTPVYAAYSPGIPVCGSSTPTPPAPKPPATPKPPAPAKTKEQKAVAWAKTQKNTPVFIGWCDRFVAQAYGKSNSGYWSAATHLAALTLRRTMHFRDYNPPAGALVFFYPGPKNGWGGHVMLSIGDGKAISSEHWIGGKRYGVGEISIHATNFGTYAGWSPANSEWPGR